MAGAPSCPSVHDGDHPLLLALRDAVADAIGLRLGEERFGDLSDWLERAAPRGVDARWAYVQALREQGDASPEIPGLAAYLTVGETYFFRNGAHVAAWRAAAIPMLAARVRAVGRARVLSLGASTGDELYTIAILLRELAPAEADGVTLLGIDVDPDAVAAARRARYSPWSLRVTPPDVARRWFQRSGRHYDLDRRICASAHFEIGNLLAADAPFLRSAMTDLILCRNVLMYFSPSCARAIAQRAADALTPGGMLFLGHAESLADVRNIDMVHRHNTFYGIRPPTSDRAGISPPDSDARSPVTPARVTPAQVTSMAREATTGLTPWPAADWAALLAPLSGEGVEGDRAGFGIGDLADRVATPSAANTVGMATEPRPATARGALSAVKSLAARSQPHGDHVLDGEARVAAIESELAVENFHAALALVASAPPQQRSGLRLSEAIALTHLGREAEARAVLARCLADDGMQPEVWYQLAVCEFGQGAIEEAKAAATKAIYLDPTFALAQLLLARIHTRRGDRRGAARGYRQAGALLPTERDGRIARFGGGFARDALLTLCRSQIRAHEGEA